MTDRRAFGFGLAAVAAAGAAPAHAADDVREPNKRTVLAFYDAALNRPNIDDLRRGPPRAAIIRSFEKMLGFQPSSKTCFLQVCAIERGGQDQLVRMRVRRGLELFEEAYRDTIVRGQEAGQFAADADARVLSTFLVANLYGLQVLGRANIAVDARTKTLATIMKALA